MTLKFQLEIEDRYEKDLTETMTDILTESAKNQIGIFKYCMLDFYLHESRLTLMIVGDIEGLSEIECAGKLLDLESEIASLFGTDKIIRHVANFIKDI